ncbi:MAG: hypothetical protein IJ692_04205 [Alloprevotella sp.]|nr:hypothetical protein [Alloprevotella sp.]
MRKRFLGRRVAACSPQDGLSGLDLKLFLRHLDDAERELSQCRNELDRFALLERTGDYCCQLGHVVKAQQYWWRAMNVLLDADEKMLSFSYRERAQALAHKADQLWRRSFPRVARLHTFASEVRMAYQDIRCLRLGE